jgi:hypothetical protein
MLKNKDFLSGMFLAFVGIFVSFYSQRYNFGSITDIGPGFFPFILGILLSFIGFIIFIKSFFQDENKINFEFKSLFYVIAGTIAFKLTFQFLGFIIATILSIFIFMVPVKIKWYKKIILGLSVSLFNYIIFIILLGVNL